MTHRPALSIKRDADGVAHIVAISGGKDSTAMALRLREVAPDCPFVYVCTPTSDELPEMFDHWRRLSDLLGSSIIPVTNGTLVGICHEQRALPNPRMRFCTRILKLEPFKAFLLKAMPAVSYVGLRADEAEREGANYGGDVRMSGENGVTQRFPLREWGWGLPEVRKYLASREIEVPERTDCALCFFQRLGEWYLLWKNHPDRWARGEQLEEDFGHTFRSKSRDTWPASMRGMRERFERGDKPDISLRMMEKRRDMCRVCTL